MDKPTPLTDLRESLKRIQTFFVVTQKQKPYFFIFYILNRKFFDIHSKHIF